ncbi:Uncharacterized protein Rs2_09479 [Raphanus sativus]|nr:Uncharacterized protein Rs2_09479 [Raphanus sativus]
MSASRKLTREQKGKRVASGSSPAGTGDEAERIHREAMMDTENMDRSQRLLVSEAAQLHREERERTASRTRESGRDGQGGARDRDPVPSYIPTVLFPEGIFEELSALPPEFIRSPVVEGQDWSNVEGTRSTMSSVKRLLRDFRGTGVTFLIPSSDQKPWSPPLGYQCVYESYFQKDTRLWFPIPRLVTSYARRRDAAISQFLNGSYRLAVALMVMAAENDVSLSVRAFEELTSVQTMNDGLWVIKMRPSYNVVTGYPSKTNDWQRYYFYIRANESAFEDPPGDDYRVLWNPDIVDHPTSSAYPEDFIASARKVALLHQEYWNTITRERIRRNIDRISRRDWDSSIPLVGVPGKRRLSLFVPRIQKLINDARKMRPQPNLSELIRAQLNLPRADPPRRASVPVAEGSPLAVPRDGSPVPVEDLPTEDPAVDIQQVVEASEDAPVITPSPSKKKGKKRSRRDSSAKGGQEERSVDCPDAEGPPKKKKKGTKGGEGSLPQERTDPQEGGGGDAAADISEETVRSSPEAQLLLNRKRKETGPSEGHAQSEDPPAPAPTTAPSQPSISKLPAGRSSASRRGPPEFPDKVSFEYDGTTPLIYAPDKCAELMSQINGGPRPLLLNDLIFKKEYTDAAQAKLRGDGSMNFVVELYDTELKTTRTELRRSEKLVAAKDAFIRRKKAEWTAETDKLKAKATRAISRRKAQKEKLATTEAALGSAQETVGILETEIALMKEKEEEAEKDHAKIIEQHEKKIRHQAMEIERLKRQSAGYFHTLTVPSVHPAVGDQWVIST